MRPDSIENLEIIADEYLGNDEKVRKLLDVNPSPSVDEGQNPMEYFNSIIDRALPYGLSSDDGRSRQTSVIKIPYLFETPALTTRYVPVLGEYSLRLFMYKPNTPNYYPSIIASWSSAGRLCLKEHITTKMFKEDNGASDIAAAAKLGLIAQSVEAYEALVRKLAPKEAEELGFSKKIIASLDVSL